MSRLPRLSQQEIDERMRGLLGWQQKESKQKESTIVREYTFPNFAAAVGFINAVAFLAEKADHHPNMELYGWNHVRIELYTHDQGGLTDHDFRLASQIEKLLQ